MTQLPDFEGMPVIGTKIAITGAGDGLSKAMAIEPVPLTVGDRVFVVLETTVEQVNHVRVKDTETLTRVQRLKAGTATIVDESLVGDVLEEQRVAIEEAQGVHRIPFPNDEDDDDEMEDL